MPKHYLNGAKWVLKNDDNTYDGILDENGHANLNNIVVGKYNFTLSKEGYETKSYDVTIDKDSFNLDVSLNKLPEEKPKSPKKKAPKKTSKKETTSKTKEEKSVKTSTKKSSKKSTKTSSKKSDKKADAKDDLTTKE